MKTTKKLKRMVAGVLASLMAMSGTANIWAADTEENVHLSMAFWAEQSEVDRLDQLLEIWKADHPNVTLDYTYCFRSRLSYQVTSVVFLWEGTGCYPYVA